VRKIEISEDERLLLRQYVQTSPVALIRLKAQALLMRANGMKLAGISDVVSRGERIVRDWLADWDGRRMASIFSGHVGNGNAAKLTKEQRTQVKETLQKPPSERDIPKEFWDVPALREYVSAEFGVAYESAQSYHFLLKFGNLSFKYPDTFDRRRGDDAAIGRRMREIRKEIQPYLADKGWEVFAADEVRIELEALTRKAWLKRGGRTVVKVDRQKEAQSYLGLLNQKSFACHAYEVPWQNQEEILKALESFLEGYRGKKICIVWGNARFHKGALIREALRKGGILERVHLINFPPYAPDHNPIEHVWNAAKGATANVQRDIFSETKKAFADFIASRTFQYQI
jgi:transposase